MVELRTPAEVHRWIEGHEDDHRGLVDSRVYEAHLLAQDRRLERIEETIRWVFRLAVTQAVALIVVVIAAFATRGGP